MKIAKQAFLYSGLIIVFGLLIYFLLHQGNQIYIATQT